MSAHDQARPTIVQPGEGKRLAGAGSSVMLGGEQTGETLAVLLTPVPPGAGPPLHVHAKDDELFLVVEGQISYFTDGCWTDVGPGGVVYFPRNTPHSYRNNGTTLARHWIITTPSGFEHFIARFTEEQASLGSAMTLARADEIGADYGYTHLGPPPQ